MTPIKSFIENLCPQQFELIHKMGVKKPSLTGTAIFIPFYLQKFCFCRKMFRI